MVLQEEIPFFLLPGGVAQNVSLQPSHANIPVLAIITTESQSTHAHTLTPFHRVCLFIVVFYVNKIRSGGVFRVHYSYSYY